LRYHGGENKVDIGIFAPTEILSIEEAEGMIEDFVGFWE
jgi:hypothetical protein